MKLKITVLTAAMAFFMAPMAVNAKVPPHSDNGSYGTIVHNDCECQDWTLNDPDTTPGTGDEYWSGNCKFAWTSDYNWDAYGADFEYRVVKGEEEYGGSSPINPYVCNNSEPEDCWSGETSGESSPIAVSLPVYPEESESVEVGISIKGFMNGKSKGETARAWVKTFLSCDAGNLPPAGTGQ